LAATTSARLSALFAILMVGTFAATAFVSWLITREAGRRELEQRIDVEIAALSLEFQTEGLKPVELAIAARSQRPGALEYRLVGADGNVRIGNLPRLSQNDGWQETSMHDPDRSDEQRLLVRTVTLPDGSSLSIGDDIGREEHVREVLLKTLGWIGLACVAVGLIVAVPATRRSLRRMDDLIAVARRVERGDLSARASVRAAAPSDDLDQLGAAINSMLDRLEALIASVRQVSTDVAHDLRTPLSHVRQRLDRLRGAVAPDERARLLTEAELKIDDLLRTFDAMLRLAELESGHTATRVRSVDLAEVADRVVDAYRPDVEAEGRQIEIDATPAIVSGDEDLLTQVIANLIENAKRHTRLGTKIRVCAKRGDGGVTLLVEDDGAGIPEGERDAVLQRFYRVEPNRATTGSGLGLSIVAAIARLHGATLTLEDAKPGLRARLVFRAV
jgi:signal transduction histidine kinase